MKQSFIKVLFVLTSLFLAYSVAWADVMPPNSHLLNRCAKIVNLSSFPEIVLIGNITGPTVENNNETFLIEEDQCLDKGYKFNTLSIYWNTKANPTTLVPKNLLIESMPTWGGYIDNKNPLIGEVFEYSIIRSPSGGYTLYKSRQTSTFNNETPPKVETFDIEKTNQNPTEIVPQSTHAKKGFFHVLGCFFKRLFGGECSVLTAEKHFA